MADKALAEQDEDVAPGDNTYGCAWVRDPEWDQPVRQATHLVVHSGAVSEALALRCSIDLSHRPIQGMWRDPGKRVDAAAWCGAYTHEFSTNVLEAFGKQLKLKMYERFVEAGMPNHSEMQRRRAD